jgi:hypothetical protein
VIHGRLLRASVAHAIALVALAIAWPVAAQGDARNASSPAASAPEEERPARPIPPGVRVPSWQELSPVQREDLAQYAEHWDRMAASRRVLILERHARWSRLPPERQARLRAGERNFRELSPAQRQQMRRSFRALRQLPPDEQRRLRGLWRDMDPRGRRDWLERGGPGIAPPP